MKPDSARAILGGLVGTLVTALAMSFISPVMLCMEMDLAKLLGSMLREGRMAVIVTQFVDGTMIFPLIYAYVLYEWLPGSPWLKGITWGVALWVISHTVTGPMMGIGFFSATVGGTLAALGSLAMHIIYGGLLGAIAGPPVAARAAYRLETNAEQTR